MEKKQFGIRGKEVILIIGIIIAIAVFLHISCWPGFWFKDTFLYKKADGSFADYYGEYEMIIEKTPEGTNVFFSVNGAVRQYRIAEEYTEILDNNGAVVEEDVLSSIRSAVSDTYIGEGSEVVSFIIEEEDNEEDLYPGKIWINNCINADSYERRGRPEMLILIIILVLYLVVDIRYPNYFFNMRIGRWSDGGQPNELYRELQIMGRVVVVFGILMLSIISFVL